MCGEKLERQAKQGNVQGSWATLFFSGRFIYKGWPLLLRLFCPRRLPTTVLPTYHAPRNSESSRQKHGFTLAYDALTESLSADKAVKTRQKLHVPLRRYATNTWQSAARRHSAQLSGQLEPVWK